ncbi:MAG: SGNH/GDSL hydrolase family protein [Chloroflexota bacterium]
MRSSVDAKRVFLKGVLLFLVLEFLIVAAPVPLNAENAYGLFGIKRERFPLSTVPPVDEALDVGNLDAMFETHVVSVAKAPNEFRVLVLGDSTIWGLQLTPEAVLPGQLNRLELNCHGKQPRFYNLSFPRSSATKDIMILDRAMSMQPDAIVWLVTWYTLMPKTRVDHWIVTQNPEVFRRLAVRFDFLPRDDKPPSLLDEVVSRNRSMFRVTRYQLYSLIHIATNQDQIAGPPQLPAVELSADETFEGLKPPTLRRNQVSIDQVRAFYEIADGIPVLLVNQPILIMKDIANSDVRYNSYYPRWVYDQYRSYLAEVAADSGWQYLDLWDVFPAEYFADTPLHLKPEAHHILADTLAPEILKACQ